MSGETNPNHHFCPPLREPTPAPTLRSDFSPTEDRVIATYFRAVAPMVCHGGKYMGGRVSLDVQYLGHRQQVSGRTLLDALADAQRLFDTLHQAPSAEAA